MRFISLHQHRGGYLGAGNRLQRLPFVYIEFQDSIRHRDSAQCQTHISSMDILNVTWMAFYQSVIFLHALLSKSHRIRMRIKGVDAVCAERKNGY